MKKKKIFICGMSTECCSYSTLTQNKEDFEVISNQKLLEHIDFNFAKYKNFDIIPNKFYRSLPGGPINKNFFIKTVKNIIKDITKYPSLDGVFIIMHGAMYVKGIDDPEGYFIRKFKNSDGFLDKLTAQDGFSGGNMCIPKNIFDKVGFFNTDLGMQGKKMGLGEESELFFRIHNQIKEVKLYNINNMSITHFEAKFKLEKKYLKDRISLSSFQFTNRLISENNLKSKVMIYGKIVKQTIELICNLILSLFLTKRKFRYLKNYWIILGILKSIKN